VSQVRVERPIVAGYARDQRVRHGRPEGTVSAAFGRGRFGRELLPDRAERGQRHRENGEPGQVRPGDQVVRAERRQDVDHQCPRGRRVRRLGPVRRRACARLLGGKRRAGPVHRRHTRENVA